jgi:SAM-dependent methyltransferase
LAISIGVLHHTADPKASFMQVARTVKRGGKLAIWVYTDPATDGSAVTRQAIEFFHEVTRACPPEVLYDIISRYAPAIRDANHPAWGSLQQVIRPSYNPDDEQCISDMFDWHTPMYRFWHAKDEVDGWFKDAGFDVTWHGEFPVSASGVKR